MLRTVWATCVLAMAVVVGCGGADPYAQDASRDIKLNSDVSQPDHPNDSGDGPPTGSDAGPTPCLVPADCPSGQRCCLAFDNGSGVVSCQPPALCPGDGVATYIACATSADCTTALPTCTFLTSTGKGDFNVCE